MKTPMAYVHNEDNAKTYFRAFWVKVPRHSEKFFARKRYTSIVACVVFVVYIYAMGVFIGQCYGRVDAMRHDSISTAGSEQLARVTLYLAGPGKTNYFRTIFWSRVSGSSIHCGLMPQYLERARKLNIAKGSRGRGGGGVTHASDPEPPKRKAPKTT